MVKNKINKNDEMIFIDFVRTEIRHRADIAGYSGSETF
jgi:hypothetical protein